MGAFGSPSPFFFTKQPHISRRTFRWYLPFRLYIVAFPFFSALTIPASLSILRLCEVSEGDVSSNAASCATLMRPPFSAPTIFRRFSSDRAFRTRSTDTS